MKAVTEFASFTLNAALKAKADLVAAGKTPEEIQESLGTTYKYEGDKLGYFITALEIAEANKENLKRVLVVRLSEGEKAPAKAQQTEDIAIYPEALVTVRAEKPKDDGKRGGKGGKGGGRDGGMKSSPWGMSPEEKAAKLEKSKASQAALAAKKAAAAK